MAKHTTHSGDAALDQNAALEQNPVYQENMAALKALLPDGYVDLQIGFPPYWKPTLGAAFKGQILYRDERDLSFPRYHVKNTGPDLMCAKGKSVDGIPTERVRTGQIFTIGAFKGLPLDRFFGLDEVVVFCKDSRKLAVTKDSIARGIEIERDFWIFEAYGSKESERILASKDRLDMEFRLAAVQNAERIAMEEIARLNAVSRAGLRPANGPTAQLAT